MTGHTGRFVYLLFILGFGLMVGCASSVSTIKTEQPAMAVKSAHPGVDSGTRSRPSAMLARARELYENGSEALERGDYETANQAFSKATEILLMITPEQEDFREAQSLLSDLMTANLELDRQMVQLEESDEERAFIDMVGDVDVLMTDEEMRTMIEKIKTLARKDTFDIPLVIHPSVIRMIRAYQTIRRKEFERGLQRMPRYIDLYRKMFKEEGLPADFAYLALIESGFNHRAYSRARAKGIWQFIYSTGRKYGLTINWWLDERGDFIRSAEAAIAYLKDLYTEFNDWWLALAAYNAGEGRLNRAIQKGGTRDFWKLQESRALPRETRNYVPAFLAAVIISKFPEAFGFKVPPSPPVEWEEVPVRGGISLRTISRLTGISEAVLSELNGGLRRRYIPAGLTYRLRVPPGTGNLVAQKLEKAPRSKIRDYIVHRVRRGDTLSEIARRYGVSLRLLMEVNQLSYRSILRIGQTIRVPMFDRRVRGSQRRTTTRGVLTGSQYAIKPGDTLYSIARAYGIDWREFLKANPGLNPRRLRPGDVIRVPGGVGQRPDTTNSGVRIHIVRPGETLYRIARLYGVSVHQIMRMNQLTKNSIIYPGNRLVIPKKENDTHENIHTKSR